MITSMLKENFKNDVKFSGWTDTQGMATHRQNKHSSNIIIGEIRAENSKKVLIVSSHGIHIRFMTGNKIESDVYWSEAVNNPNFEQQVMDFLNFPFAKGREVYRSMMSIVSSAI